MGLVYTMAWIVLFVAGGFEVGFAATLAGSEGFTRPGPSVATVVLGVLAVVGLSRALLTLPLSTGYAVFTAVGTVGATAYDLIRRRRIDVSTIGAIGLILAGVLVLRLKEASA